MDILIIEDEPAAVRRLKKMVSVLMPESRFLAELDSVETSVEWLENHPSPDLMFMDIHLADGPSFDIFESVFQENKRNSLRIKVMKYFFKN